MKSFIAFATLLSLTTSALATNCNKPFEQCGGTDWEGVSCCTKGYTCKSVAENWSQCVPRSEVSASKKYLKTKKTNKKVKTTKAKKLTTTTTTTTTTIATTIFDYEPTATNVVFDDDDSNSSFTSIDTDDQLVSDQLVSDLVGYASLNGGTNGGENGPVTLVSNQMELEAALKGDDSKIIKVNGIIDLNHLDINVGSNTSIIGADNNSGFINGGLKIKKARNIIIQNLKFSYCLGKNADCINAQKSTNIWVDHCEFSNDRDHGKDYYDGLVDFTHACDYITLSWNFIHDHFKASLVGHSDGNGAEDTGKLHITYHHNYFKNVGSRLPSLRFGTGHIFNNVYEDVEISCINIRMGAKALVEGNAFRNSNRPISTNLSSKQQGSVVEVNNDFGTTGKTNSITQTDGLTSVPYKYVSDYIEDVYDNVVSESGPQ